MTNLTTKGRVLIIEDQTDQDREALAKRYPEISSYWTCSEEEFAAFIESEAAEAAEQLYED